MGNDYWNGKEFFALGIIIGIIMGFAILKIVGI
jgi:hypothetical protein